MNNLNLPRRKRPSLLTFVPALIGSVLVSSPLLAAVGDYNNDGVVGAADYSVWRNTLGDFVSAPSTGADGDGDGFVGQNDYFIWADEYEFISRSVPSNSPLAFSAGSSGNTLTVQRVGSGVGFDLWEFSIDPSSGSAIAVELAVSVVGADVQSAVIANNVMWDIGNPGSNPFTASETIGVVMDSVADTLFVSYGSTTLPASPSRVPFLLVETSPFAPLPNQEAGLTPFDVRFVSSTDCDGCAVTSVRLLSIPEPTSFFLSILGLVSFAGRRRAGSNRAFRRD